MITLQLSDYGFVSSGTSLVHVKKRRNGFSVFMDVSNSSPVDSGEHGVSNFEIGRSELAFNWREMSRILLGNDEGIIEEDAYKAVEVSGLSGIKSEILVLSWGRANDEIVNWLLIQTEMTLEYLESTLGSLFDFTNIEILSEIITMIETTSESQDLMLLVSKFENLEGVLEYLEQSCSQLEKVKKEKNKELQKKFSKAIRNILDIHGDKNSVHPSKKTKSELLEIWLKDYINKYGELPKGSKKVVVSIPYKYGYLKRDLGEINFDNHEN